MIEQVTLRQLRDLPGLTQVELAARMQASQAQLSARGLAHVEIESAMFAPFVDARSRFPIALEEGARSWPGIFQYTRGRLPERPDSSVWRFRMFDAHEFFAITGGDPKAAVGK